MRTGAGFDVREEYRTQRLRLVLTRPELAAQVAGFFRGNRAFFAPTEPTRDEVFYTGAGQRLLLAQDAHDAQAGTNLRYWLMPPEEERVIGNVALNNIVLGAFRSAFLSYRLAEAEVGKGLATEAVRKLIEVAFGAVGLHRLEANIMPGNTASLRLVQKLGFQDEGLARKYLKIAGVWEDHTHMVLLNEDG